MSMQIRSLLLATACCVASSAWAQAQGLNAGLVARYEFDGNAVDSSGNGNNGTTHGGTAATTDRNGKANSALAFNGIDGFVSVADSPSLNPTDQVTIAYWIRVDSINSVWTPIVYKGFSSSGGCYGGREYTVWLNNAPFFHSASAGAGGCSSFLDGKTVSVLNKWTHVALAIDRRTAKKATLYINGNLQVQADDPNTSFAVSASELLIGKTAETSSSFSLFEGALDDLRIYNRALSKADVQRLYRTSLQVNGSTGGFNTLSVTCRNVRTSKQVTFTSTNGALSTWNCEQQGLPVRAGDRVEITLSGVAHK
jgi:hypothetical protein